MIRYHHHKPKILFVGINPHPGSYRRGVPFSNNKMFWYLLSRSGLLEENVSELKDDLKLRNLYGNKFCKVYRYGFINIINRPTHDITELAKGEEISGRNRIRKIIKNERPPIVCFIGKVSYEKFSGSKNFSFGWQPDIMSSKTFVMHFPLHGKASVRIRELRRLKNIMDR